MKFQITNNEPLQFYNAVGDLIGTIEISGSGDMILRPESGSTKNIIIGDTNVAADIQFGIVSAPINVELLGGGTITSNGNTLNIGSETNGDTVNLYNAVYSQSLQVTGSVDVNGSISGSTFIGSGVGLNFADLPTTEPSTTGSLWISGSSAAHPNSGYLMVFNP